MNVATPPSPTRPTPAKRSTCPMRLGRIAPRCKQHATTHRRPCLARDLATTIGHCPSTRSTRSLPFVRIGVGAGVYTPIGGCNRYTRSFQQFLRLFEWESMRATCRGFRISKGNIISVGTSAHSANLHPESPPRHDSTSCGRGKWCNLCVCALHIT